MKGETACLRQPIIRKQVTGLRRMAKKNHTAGNYVRRRRDEESKNRRLLALRALLRKNTSGQGLGRTRKKGCGYNRAQHDGQ